MDSYVKPIVRVTNASVSGPVGSSVSSKTVKPEDTENRIKVIGSLGESALDQYFSQQSDEQLADLAAEIDPSLTINGGLSADDRRDFFNLLAKGLSPENRKRWAAQLSEGLGREFDTSISTFSEPQDQPFPAHDGLSFLDEPGFWWSSPPRYYRFQWGYANDE